MPTPRAQLRPPLPPTPSQTAAPPPHVPVSATSPALGGVLPASWVLANGGTFAAEVPSPRTKAPTAAPKPLAAPKPISPERTGKAYSVVVDPKAAKPPRATAPSGNPFEFFCGGRPRDAARQCGAINERTVLQNLARAGRSLGRAVGDAASAATLAVDDLDRHTLEKVVLTVKHKVNGAPALQQEAPTVYARLRARPAGVDERDDRLSHTERVVRVAAEHKAMAPLSFVLDGVIGGESDQASAYAAVGASAVEALLRGESTSLVAFGASGSGKSYTLFGPPDLLSNPSGSAWQEWGLLPRASHHLFSRASAVGGVEGLLGPGSTVSCSFLEVRDEQVHDLLGKGRDLRIRESARHGVHVPGATKRLVEWEEDVMRALVLGLQKRGADATDDAASSTWGGGGGGGSMCSHTVFTLTVSRRTADGRTVESRLQIVDLGSAEAPRPGTSRVAARQATQSLAALDRCMQSLCDTGHAAAARPPTVGEPNPQQIPYRDSKLTWLMRDALGGAAGTPGVVHRTKFISVLSAEPTRLPASINSLRFAHRCRQARLWVPEEENGGLGDTPLRLTAAPQTLAPPSPPIAPTTDGSPMARLSGRSSPPAASQLSRSATSLSMQLGPGPDSDSSDDGEEDTAEMGDAAATPATVPMAVPTAVPTTVPTAVPNAPPMHEPIAVDLANLSADLSERSKEKVELQHKLALVTASLGNGVAVSAAHGGIAPLGRHVTGHPIAVTGQPIAIGKAEEAVAPEAPPIQSSDGWEELQSAHAHMLLLEARLAELSGEPTKAA